MQSELKEVILRAGERGYSRVDQPPAAVQSASAADHLGWMQGKLAFFERPLRELAEELQRKYNVRIHLFSPGIDTLTVTGSFDRQLVGYINRITRMDLIRRYAAHCFVICLMIIFSSVLYGQQGQRISINHKDAPLRSALLNLAEESGVEIIFSDDLVKNHRITLKAENVELHEALNLLLKDTQVGYNQVASNQLVLVPKNGEGLRGIVRDETTGQPLYFVNVFLANTSKGTTTNTAGYFEITKVPSGVYQLIVHHVGYEIGVVNVQFPSAAKEFLDIRLKVKPIQGEEVKVEASNKQWKKDLKRFIKEFIGTSKNARQCTLLNPFVLNFYREAETGQFRATSDSIIVIENRAIGYRIHLLLSYYGSQQESLRYLIYPKFEELVPKNDRQYRQWQKARENTYTGSYRHFLAACARGRLRQDGFSLYSTGNIRSRSRTSIKDPYETIIKPDTLGFTRLQFQDYLVVSIRHKGNALLHLPQGYIVFNEYGIVQPPLKRAEQYRYWYYPRIADFLPLDYFPL